MQEIETEESNELLEKRSGKSPLAWIVLSGIVITAALGLAGWWWGSNLKPAADSPEVDFARDMSVHHGQAVEMAFKIRDRTTNPELRYLTFDIILTQQAQLGQMQGWLAVWGYPLASSKPVMGGYGQMMGMATLEQINELESLPVAEAEISFLKLMIRHHQGGVSMARQVIGQTQRPEVLRLANAIVVSQQSEIKYLQSLLKQRGVELSESAPAPSLAVSTTVSH